MVGDLLGSGFSSKTVGRRSLKESNSSLEEELCLSDTIVLRSEELMDLAGLLPVMISGLLTGLNWGRSCGNTLRGLKGAGDLSATIAGMIARLGSMTEMETRFPLEEIVVSGRDVGNNSNCSNCLRVYWIRSVTRRTVLCAELVPFGDGGDKLVVGCISQFWPVMLSW